MTDETLAVRCACGWEATGTEADVVPATIEHGRRLHNMKATPEQVLAMAVRSEVDEPVPRSLGSSVDIEGLAARSRHIPSFSRRQ
jgi:predicted small metal-binding protein